jgi:hypothetical protein
MALTILTVTCFAAPSLAADDASVKKDLFTVITLQGLPCGEVVDVVTATTTALRHARMGTVTTYFSTPKGE